MIPLRYGHCDGHTDICYSNSSLSFVSCGSEGDVRVWEDINDTDQKDLCIGEKAWAVCQRSKSLYVGTDKNIVQAYTFPDLEVDGIITRFTAPVTQIDISPDEKKLAAGSCDMDIHVVDMDTMESRTLSGHMAPVLSLSLDPRLSFLASSSCDGSVRIWNINTGEVLKQWDSFVEKSNSFELSPSLCRIHFEPIHGRFLAVPVKNKIHIYARETWSLVKTLFCTDSNFTFSVVRYSKCGKFLACGSIEGEVYIFNVSSEKIISETTGNGYSNVHAITAISWHSESTNVVYANVAGQIGELMASATLPSTEESTSAVDLANIPLGVPDFEDDDDDSENVISLDKIKAQSEFSQNRFTSSPIKIEDKDDKESLISERFSKFEAKIPFAELQEPFQPSSTPLHLQERFLVWNNVGIVRGFSQEDSNDELDVEFHDTTIHHGFRMNNTPGYNMCALTDQVLVLTSPRLAEIPSKLFCILLKAWDGQKEWDTNLGVEDAIGVAAGKNWVAVVTDRLLLRIFSIDGTQTDIISIPGPLVSLTGQSNQLTVYFHSAQGREKEQFISYLSATIDRNSRLVKVLKVAPLPISPSSTVKWVGYSDQGSPCSLDSEGLLRLLYNEQWRPICSLEDRAKGKFDHYFVLGLCEKLHTIRCILCKGAYYPPVVPKPIVNEIQWQIPLSDLDTDKGQLEEELLRAVITLPHLNHYEEDFSDSKTSIEKTISVTVMKLFALACRTGLESRAVSLCESMPTVDVVRLASKYAAKLGRHQLANRVSEVASKMIEEDNCRLQKEREVNGVEEDTDETVNTWSKQQEGSSQDIFADHSDSVRTSSKISDKENLIMKMRKKKSAILENGDSKPSIIEGTKRFSRNPFKKSQIDDDKDASDKESVSSPKPNYIEWFNSNKSVLQAEHPLLKDGELAIIGMKKYRQLHCTAKPETVSSPTSQPQHVNKEQEKEDPKNEETEPKKRKLSDMMSESAKKKRNSNDKKSTVGDTNTSLSEKKPLNAASKLKNFSFAKRS